MPTPYPRLTGEQKDRLLPQVAVYLAAMAWCRAGHPAQAFVYQGEQLELF
jgi:hypothetical protein